MLENFPHQIDITSLVNKALFWTDESRVVWQKVGGRGRVHQRQKW